MKPLTRTQWAILTAGVGAIALIALVAWIVDRKEAADRAPVASRGMTGMPGMSMPAGGTVQLTTAQMRQFGVTFGSVEQRMLVTEIRVAGTVVVDEMRLVQVALKFGGFVERLHANVTGQYVRAGQPLMEVYSPEVYAAMEELLVAVRLERTSAGQTPIPGVPTSSADLVVAARRRLELLGVSPGDIDATIRQGEPSRTVTVYSPASGIILDRQVTQGQAVQAAQTLYTIADVAGVWVNADVRETDAALLRVGIGADVELASMPGRPFKGMVTYVYPTLNPQTRTVTARVTVANAGGQLRPGMFATVLLRSPSRRALTVPTPAVVRTGERTLVFVDLGGGRIEPKPIEIGQSASEYTEVLAGLEPGQRVVTSAQFLLDSESNLAEVMRSMIGQGAAGMTDMKGMPGMDMGGKPTDKGARVKP
ncbi:MAG: efflux RND transporter periplasmic adaptor subunit [Gemmatimonadaceae bacterium]